MGAGSSSEAHAPVDPILARFHQREQEEKERRTRVCHASCLTKDYWCPPAQELPEYEPEISIFMTLFSWRGTVLPMVFTKPLLYPDLVIGLRTSRFPVSLLLTLVRAPHRDSWLLMALHVIFTMAQVEEEDAFDSAVPPPPPPTMVDHTIELPARSSAVVWTHDWLSLSEWAGLPFAVLEPTMSIAVLTIPTTLTVFFTVF